MTLVKLKGVSLSVNGNALFSNLNFSIFDGDKIGIVGDNGCGKSSLLRSIAKQLDEHEGDISHSKNLRCQYVEQGFSSQWDEFTALEILENCILDAASNGWRAGYIFEQFEFPMGHRSLLFKQLSGGWKKMLMIARAVLLEPDLLLLDEPTNHLDQSHVEIISRLLRDGITVPTFAVVSHNRYFLDLVTKSTLFFSDRDIFHFNVSYTLANKLFLEQEKARCDSRADAVGEIQRMKKSAHLQRQIGVDNFSDTALQKAKTLDKKIKILEAALPRKPMLRKQEIALNASTFNGRRVLQIDGLKVCSPQGNLLFFVQSLVVNKGDRLVISGANGCGKSTLLKLIINAAAGINTGPSVKIGVLDQELSSLPLDSTMLNFFTEQFELDQQRAVNYLALSGFSYLETQKKIGHLSYGERSRIALLTLRLASPNFFILDEPTNHLDISSQETLESEIRRLNAAAIIVSHDFRFVENVGTRFFSITRGNLEELGSSYS